MNQELMKKDMIAIERMLKEKYDLKPIEYSFLLKYYLHLKKEIQ